MYNPTRRNWICRETPTFREGSGGGGVVGLKPMIFKIVTDKR